MGLDPNMGCEGHVDGSQRNSKNGKTASFPAVSEKLSSGIGKTILLKSINEH